MKLRFNALRRTGYVLAAMSVVFAAAVSASAAAVTDPANDFLPSFAGPHNSDLDVVAANVVFNGSSFDFTATLDGVVDQSPGAVYVFGVNRGKGTPKFANIAEGNVIFDATFVISQNGTGTVHDLISKTNTTISGVALSGDMINGVVPASDLPSEGFNPSSYTFALWPEFGTANAGNTEISDFAPNDANARVSSAAPEPGSMALVGGAALLMVGWLRRRAHSTVVG